MNRLKGCTHQGHENFELIYICTKKGCDNLSRVVCFKCMQQQPHPHYDNLLNINEIEQYQKGQFIENWPQNEQLRKISSFNKDTLIEEIEKSFEALLQNFTQRIQAIKKECKIQILEQSQKLDQLKKQLDETFNLEPLKQAIQDYQNSKINIQQLNTRISDFSNSEYLINSEKEILQAYKNQVVKQINLEPLNIVEQKIEKLFQNFPNKILKNKSQFTFQPLNECEQYVQVDYMQKNIVQRIKTGNFDNVRSIEAFEGKEKIEFKFKINKNPDSYFFLGFATENESQQTNCFSFNSGIQLDLNHIDYQNKGKFVVEKGNIAKSDLFQQKDVVYDVEICVEDKLFVLRNEQNNFEMKWQGNFQPEKNQKWVLVVGSNNNGSVLWEIEVL